MDKPSFTFYYGIILIVVGIGVFMRIPQLMPQVSAIEFFSDKTAIVRFCFYLLGGSLILAGGIRVFKNYKSPKD